MRRFTLVPAGLALAAALLLVLAPARARAEEYVIGAEDVLQVSVWMHPELERSVTVRADGSIVLPPIGEVKAAGQTPTQLGARLADRLSTYLRQTTTVTVSVTQYLSQSVYVSGAVAKPGRYGFERVPSVLDVINQAGGATTGADLTQVQVVRREGERGRPMVVDVARALREGSSADLPALKPGDSIVVPAGAGPGVSTGETAGVLGEVNRPGLYPVGTGQDLWTVLAAAGGATSRADLADVRVVVRQRDSSTSVFAVNLKQQLRGGAREPYVVHSGDVVVVGGRAGFGNFWGGLTQVLGLGLQVANLVALTNYTRNH